MSPDKDVKALETTGEGSGTATPSTLIDIFDVVFGDLQRSATHRGQQRRTGESPRLRPGRR